MLLLGADAVRGCRRNVGCAADVYPMCRFDGVSRSQVQNKGGGHGEIGFHLAKNLADKDLTVTIVQDSAAKKKLYPSASTASSRRP